MARRKSKKSDITKILRSALPKHSGQMENRCVAFIDILGFKKLVEDMTSGKANLFEALKSSLEWIQNREKQTYKGMARIMWRTHEMTSFSDHVAISDLTEHYFRVLLSARKLYQKLLFSGILCRGAIAFGQTYHRGRVVFGEGVIRAHELESAAAVYPRIVVEDEIRKLLETADAESRLNVKVANFLCRDHDGLWFIDPFGSPRPGETYGDGENPEKIRLDSLTMLREKLYAGIRGPDAGKLTLGQIAKHRWLIRRFNCTLQALNVAEPGQIEC